MRKNYTLGLSLVLAFALLLVTSLPFTRQPNLGSSVDYTQVEQVETQDRFSGILEDFEAGSLSLRQAATYALDALFRPEKLPTRYRAPSVHPDAVIAWLAGNYQSFEADIQQAIDLEIDTDHTEDSAFGVTGLTSWVNNAYIMVHYTTTGAHASSAAYATSVLNAATIARSVLVPEKGYLPPVSDPLLAHGLTGRTHMYIFDVSAVFPGAIGVASPAHLAPATTNPTDRIGHAGIDKDLTSGSPSYQREQTTAHELTHIVQYAYRAVTADYTTGPVTRSWWLEAHASYMQHVAFHSGTTQYNRFSIAVDPGATTNLDQGVFTTTGNLQYYVGALWLEYLDLHFGDRFIRGIWDNLVPKPAGYYSGTPYTTSDVWSAIRQAFQNEGTSPWVWFLYWARANRAMMTAPSGAYANSLFGYTWPTGDNHFYPNPILPKAELETTLNFAGAPLSWTSNVNGDGILKGFGADYIKVTEAAAVASTKITVTCTANGGPFDVLIMARTGATSSSGFVQLSRTESPANTFTATVNISSYTDAGGEVIVILYNLPTTVTSATLATNSQYTITLSTP